MSLSQTSRSALPPFLSGGEMGELIFSFDWTKTPLGSLNAWPQSLRTALSIVLNSKFPMLLFWGNDSICFYNDAFQVHLGNDGKHPNVLGRPAAEAWAETLALTKPIVDQVLLNGEANWSEDQLIPVYRNGKLENAYWTFSHSAVIDEAGNRAGVFITCAETTEKASNFKKLQESKDQFEFAVEAMEVATWDLNPITNKFTANARYTEWFGIAALQETNNDLALKVISDEDRDRVIAAYTKALNYFSGYKYDIEYTICPQNKPSRILRAKGKVWFNHEKIAYRFNGTLQDVTEEVTARKKLEESEEKLRIAMEGGELGTYDFYPQTGKLIWSVKAKELFGLPPEADVDLAIYFKGLHPADKERSDALVKNAMQPQSGGLYENEYRTIGVTDGKLRWVRSKGRVSFDADGKPVRFTGITQDITEHKKTEYEFRMVKEQLELTIQNTPAAIYLYGKKGETLFANNHAAHLMGYQTAEELLLEKDFSVLKKSVQQIFDVLTEDGDPFQVDDSPTSIALKWGKAAEAILLFVKKVDGTKSWVLTKSTPIFDGNGEVLMVLTTSTDITLQKTSEETLRYRKALLEAHNQASLDGILLVDAQGKIISYNQRFIEIWNMPQEIVDVKDDEAALSFAMSQLVNPQQFIDKVKWLYKHPTETSIDELEYKDGKIVERYGYPVVGEDGTYYAWSWNFRDITKHRLFEKTISESEERFRLLAETLPQLIWMTDERGQPLYASSRWKEYTGMEPTGTGSWQQMVHPDDMPNIVKQWTNSITTGKLYKTEVRLKNKKGDYCWHAVQGEPIRDEKGNITKWIGAFTDIHDQKESEQKLEALVAQRTLELHRSNEDLQQFAHVASHDLKEPVRKLKTFSSRLNEEFKADLPEKARMYIDKMGTAADRMYAMIDGVLLYSSLTAVEQTFEKIDLNNTVRNIEEDLEVLIQQKGAVINYKNLHVIEGSAILIYQLFYNLINNSLKFSKKNEKPVIQITSKDIKYTDEVEIVVQDNGIGFSPDYAEKIFKTFTRLNSKDQYEGTGLGLSLCKKIAERHQGTITANGKEDEGTEFIIVLPRQCII